MFYQNFEKYVLPTLGNLSGPSFSWVVWPFLLLCEGDGDVVGVVTPLRGVAQVFLHGVQVIELSVLLGVHEEGEVEKDGEGKVEVEREESEVKERRTCMTMG